jgi:hypothetical protein
MKQSATQSIQFSKRSPYFIVFNQCTKHGQLHNTGVAYSSDEKGAELE